MLTVKLFLVILAGLDRRCLQVLPLKSPMSSTPQISSASFLIFKLTSLITCLEMPLFFRAHALMFERGRIFIFFDLLGFVGLFFSSSSSSSCNLWNWDFGRLWILLGFSGESWGAGFVLFSGFGACLHSVELRLIADSWSSSSPS